MQLTITLNPRDPSEIRSAIGTLNLVLATLTAEPAASAGPDTAEKAAVKPKAAPKPKAEPTPPAPPANDDLDGFADEAPATLHVPTEKELSDVTTGLGKAGKRDQLIALLAKYGAPRASLIEGDTKRASYYAEAKALLEG